MVLVGTTIQQRKQLVLCVWIGAVLPEVTGLERSPQDRDGPGLDPPSVSPSLAVTETHQREPHSGREET